jgi:hypothetical protein
MKEDSLLKVIIAGLSGGGGTGSVSPPSPQANNSSINEKALKLKPDNILFTANPFLYRL